MIINLPTISGKRLVSNPDGSTIIELAESCFQYKKQAQVVDFLVVTGDQAGRPWMIAQALYLRENALAALFFLNGYPNPYAIAEGDKLLVFDDNTLNTVLVDNNTIKKELMNITPQTTQASQKRSKLTKIDQNRQDVLQKLASSNLQQVQAVVAPNASTGVAPITASDGLVTLGTDVSDTRCKSTNLSDTQTRTEQIRAAIKKKLGVTV